MKYLFLILPLTFVYCTLSPQKSPPRNETNSVNSYSTITTIKTKFDSEVELKLTVFYGGKHDFSDKNNVINQTIRQSISDSLEQYTMYEMWATKRHNIEKTTERIFKHNYAETENVYLLDVLIPDEALNQFKEREKARGAIIDELDVIYNERKMLSEKLDSNGELSDSEVKEIEANIEKLALEWKAVQERGKRLTLDFEL